MSEVLKGKVLSVKEAKARVAPLEDIDQVSALIDVPETIGELEKGDTVAYTIFNDYTGVVLARL